MVDSTYSYRCNIVQCILIILAKCDIAVVAVVGKR